MTQRSAIALFDAPEFCKLGINSRERTGIASAMIPLQPGVNIQGQPEIIASVKS
ncbi:MAG: hypothetical protein KME35_13220 [Aphanocapsa sp. GSE-SYN-MK-11-07L]|jgi:hypothetical protein|nr:hypothetical protein [Aphanocapsa sp. GSE-SYN-MK-11-07L]